MAPIIEPGTYAIKNAAYDDRVIDVSGGDKRPNTPIIGYPYHKGENQQWELESVNQANEYIIKSKLGDIYLNLGSTRQYPPSIAVQYTYVLWSIEPAGNGLYRIHFPYQDGVVDLATGQQSTQLTLPAWAGEQHQKWIFEKV